tara:strand:+ start:2728 stop:3402 length:675 start_codon:yes stop_codon:yes gene_type:complete
MKFKLIILLCISCLILSGCARTIDTQEEVLNLNLTVTLKESPNLSNTIYIIAFSSLSNLLPSLSNPGEYFFFPGKVFNSTALANLNRDVNYYYQNYFNTWSKFIFISGSTIELFDSGSLFLSSTTDNFSYNYSQNFEYIFSTDTFSFSLVMDISKLGFETNDLTYVRIYTFDKSEFIESGLFQDISDNTEMIQFTQFNQKTITSIENIFLNPHADIVKWSYSIY